MIDNKLKRILATMTYLTPLTVFAHGEEVLSTIFLEFGLFVVFILILVLAKLRIEGKLIIGGLYLLATYLTFRQIDSLPYRDNMMRINILVTIIPSTVFILTYFGLRNWFKKKY